MLNFARHIQHVKLYEAPAGSGDVPAAEAEPVEQGAEAPSGSCCEAEAVALVP